MRKPSPIPKPVASATPSNPATAKNAVTAAKPSTIANPAGHDPVAAPLGPNQIVRLHDGWKYFGLRKTQIDEKIQSGEIPTPIKLSASGHARGWLGSQILEWQEQKLKEPRPLRPPRKAKAA